MTRRWMIDFDGVLADLNGAFVRSVNDKFNVHYDVEEITDWHWWDRQTKHFADYAWRQCYPDADWFLSNVQPYPGALRALADLVTSGDLTDDCPVRIVTARRPEHTKMLVPWLAKHLPVLDLKGIIVCEGGYPKNHYCKLFRLDTVVEDGAHNLRVMNPHRQRLYLVDRPWNQAEIVPGSERISGLHEAVDREATVLAG